MDFAPEILPNFSPLMASALCGAVFLPGFLGLVVPVVALLVSDALISLHYGSPVISSQLIWTLPCYLLAVGTGWLLRNRRKGESLSLVLCGTVLVSGFFYIVTNTGCWIDDSAYPRTFSGWMQALTTGLPGYPPSWYFFRNSLMGDLFFAILFVTMERLLSEKSRKYLVAA
jgi:hypothetical protein